LTICARNLFGHLIEPCENDPPKFFFGVEPFLFPETRLNDSPALPGKPHGDFMKIAVGGFVIHFLLSPLQEADRFLRPFGPVDFVA